MASKLALIAPRIGKAHEEQRAESMRGIHRCSCNAGWRINGLEYEAGCIERLEWAQTIRDRREQLAADQSRETSS